MTSYFEVAIEGGESFSISPELYAAGRAMRRLPHSITLTLQGYRYRPATASSALFPPRLIVNARDIADTAPSGVVGEAGARRPGASICLTERTSDTTASCTDSELSSYSFTAEVGSSLPTFEISIADGDVTAQITGYQADRVTPIPSPTAALFEREMTAAILAGNAYKFNAIRLPIAIGRNFAPDPPIPFTSDLIFNQIHGDDPSVTEGHFVASHRHTVDAAAPPPINIRASVVRAPLYIVRTSADPYDPASGGVCYLAMFSDVANTWTSELLQMGSALSFFTGDDARLDVLVGNVVTDSPPTIFPVTLLPFLTIRKARILPMLRYPLVPTNTGVQVISYALPIRSAERGVFAGTFTLDYNE